MKIKITGAPGKGKSSKVPSTVAMGRVRWTGFPKDIVTEQGSQDRVPAPVQGPIVVPYNLVIATGSPGQGTHDSPLQDRVCRTKPPSGRGVSKTLLQDRTHRTVFRKRGPRTTSQGPQGFYDRLPGQGTQGWVFRTESAERDLQDKQ
jgi:hypothetical protein